MENAEMIDRLHSPHPPRWMKLVRLLVRIALGALFIFAGVTKAYDPGAFAIEIQRYNLVPWMPAALASVYLPWLEIILGVCLIIRKFEQASLLLIGGLLLIFTFALASATFRGLGIDCGCFGKAFTATGTIFPLVRNVVLLGLTVFLWFGPE